jgi:hypothetical protein
MQIVRFAVRWGWGGGSVGAAELAACGVGEEFKIQNVKYKREYMK